jgi:DNA polymerase III sliding clamp (beta) subunit (PCNA family)
MSTSTIEKIGITATIVKPEDLRNLLLGALVAVCKDSSLPVLNGVQLTMKEGVLTASSTDRYRLITGTLGVLEVERGEDFTALIHRDDVKRIVNALKTTGDWPTVAVTPADRFREIVARSATRRF